MADEISLESVLAQPTAEPSTKPGKGERSLEDVMGVSTDQSYFPGLIKRTAATAAGVGDFIWGLLPQALGVGMDISTRVRGAAQGEDRRVTAQAAQMASQWASDLGGNPLQKLMTGLGYGEDYSSSDVSKGLKWLSENIDKGAEWIEKNTKGHVLKEDAQSLFNTLTLGVLNLRKGGLFKDTPPSEKLGKGPIGGENRGTYYEPEHVEAKASEATAEVTTPLPPPALSRAAQLSGDMADPFIPGEPGSGLPKPEAPAAKPGEVSLESVMPEAFQIGTAGKQAPKAEFKATAEWQEVPPGTALEPGLDIRMDMKTGKNYARTTPPYDNLPGGTEPKAAGGYEGPGAEYEPTATKPSLGERFVELWRNDRRWTSNDKLSLAIGAAATGSILLDPEKWKELGLVGGAALAVKGKGGMWHPEAVERLAEPLRERLGVHIMMMPPEGDAAINAARIQEGLPPNAAELAAPGRAAWQEKRNLVDRMVRNYLNKYAGTEGDPLKDVEIPYGNTTEHWGVAFDESIKTTIAAMHQNYSPMNPATWWHKVPGGETIYDIKDSATASAPIRNYLSHVGDYLRQKVSPEKLQQYDLVRAVKETKAWDDELAKQMEKQRADLSKLMPVHKAYPDGFKWVEVRALQESKLPEGYKIEERRDAYGNQGFALTDSKGNFVEHEGVGGASGRSPILYKTKTEAEKYIPQMATRILLNQEGEMMGHCVGGYCDYVSSGDTKIYSLRDPKGAAHVTVEVAPKGSVDTVYSMPPEDGILKPENYRSAPDILQIKGKQNRAPTAEYLPYVQDFVKSGKWGSVQDLQGTGLWRVGNQFLTPDEAKIFASKAYQQRYGNTPKLDTQQDVAKVLADLGIRNPEWGAADPRLLARLAALGLGATAGAYLGDDAKSALIGAGIGLGLSVVKPSAAIALFKKATAPDTRMRINHLADDYDTAVGRAGLAAWQLQQKVEQLVPKAEGRKKITYAIDEGNFELLNPSERAAAGMLRNTMQETGAKARDAGVLRDMIDNYITHLWGKEGAAKIDALVQRVGGPNMSPESRFALTRKYSTLAEGKRAGLTPLTEDASAITGIYLNSISRSMANKALLDSLKGQVEPTTGNKIVQGAREAPGNYVSIDHPQMRGLRVHPDIAPSLRFVFDATEPGTILRGLEAVSIATKRSAVSFSMFHAKALLDAFVGASKLRPGYIAAGAAAGALVGQDDPITYALIGSGVGMMAPGMKHIAQAAAPKVFGENKYLRGLRTADPKMAEMIDLSIQGGLKYQLKGQRAALEDVYGTHDQFYKALKWLQGQADAAIPGAGLAIKGIEKVNRGVDTFMWERLHAGMKLQTFAEKYETLLQNNAKAHEANPRVPLKSKQELAGIAASFTNDIFGGLNWRRAAEQAKTKWGRDISLAAMSPTGRRVAQVMLFAPDWTLSTTRAAVQAFGKGTGVKGLMEPQTIADLHRQYVLRSAIYYAAMGDGLNYAMSGHHLWENQDPTTLDVGDGRKMQWSKHTMEPVHWITKPGQQMLNKLAYVPRELLNQLMGTEYLSTSGHAPRMQSRLGHAIKSLSPISVQQSFEAGEGSGIAGFMGSPIYGKTYQQRDTEKRIRQLERSLGVTR